MIVMKQLTRPTKKTKNTWQNYIIVHNAGDINRSDQSTAMTAADAC